MEEDIGASPARVMVHIKLPNGASRGAGNQFDSVAEECGRALQASGTGQLDGTETTSGFLIIHCIGANADNMAAELQQSLHNHRLPPGSYLLKQHSTGNKPDEQIAL